MFNLLLQFSTEIINGNLRKKVLISTNVLVNGVSITDPQLKHIVISSYDFVSVFQMIGRKRLNPDETVHIYLHVPDAKTLRTYINRTNKLLAMIVRFLASYPNTFLHDNWRNLTDDVRNLFYVDNGNWLHLNYFAYYALTVNKDFYTTLLSNTLQDPERAYPNLVHSWFGLEPINCDCQTSPDTADIKERLVSFSTFLKENPIVSSVDKDKFYAEFMRHYDSMSRASARRGKGREVACMKQCLLNLNIPCLVQKRNTNWILIYTEKVE